MSRRAARRQLEVEARELEKAVSAAEELTAQLSRNPSEGGLEWVNFETLAPKLVKFRADLESVNSEAQTAQQVCLSTSSLRSFFLKGIPPEISLLPSPMFLF